MFIEAIQMPGKGQITLTGQLGDVMKESAQAAWSLLRARAGPLGIPLDAFTQTDVHLHLPAGAVPKDGPSAGIAIATALASRSEEHTSELQSLAYLVCRLLLEKKK